MGVYTYFELRQADGKGKDLTVKSTGLAVLWLACFRPSDVVLTKEGGFDITSKIRCNIQTARRQFEKGFAVLCNTFPETDFGIGEKTEPPDPPSRPIPGLEAFREFLAMPDAVEVELNFSEPCIYEGEFPIYLLHALLGFWDPGLTMFYRSSRHVDHRARFDPVVMTWGNAIRAVTMGHEAAQFQKPGIPVLPSSSLFTGEEYLKCRKVLAGCY